MDDLTRIRIGNLALLRVVRSDDDMRQCVSIASGSLSFPGHLSLELESYVAETGHEETMHRCSLLVMIYREDAAESSPRVEETIFVPAFLVYHTPLFLFC